MKLTIFKRLVLGHLIILFLVIFMGTYVTAKLVYLHHVTREIANVDGRSISIVEHLQTTVFSLEMFQKKFLLSNDPDYYKQFQELKTYFNDDIQKLEFLLNTPMQKQELNNVKKQFNLCVANFEQKVTEIANQEKSLQDATFSKKSTTIITTLNTTLKKIIQIIKQERNRKIILSSKMSKQVLNLTTIVTILTILLGFIISFVNTRSITRSITVLKQRTSEISEGRFEEIPQMQAPKEIQDLARHFNAMCRRLKELDTLKTDFISHVSHELRTPLTAIKEASSMLKEGLFSDSSKKQNELYSLIQSECGRLINSVSKILDLSRMEVNMMDYHHVETDIADIIRRSILKLAILARKNKIDLEFKPPSELPMVRVDQEKIGEVLDNLIGNALKYTNSEGEIIIEAKFNQPEKHIRVSVLDNGCGIQEDNLKNIFNKFKRIDNGFETNRGSGLGLTISKHIILAHGGKIWAQSDFSRGTTVLFTLPV